MREAVLQQPHLPLDVEALVERKMVLESMASPEGILTERRRRSREDNQRRRSRRAERHSFYFSGQSTSLGAALALLGVGCCCGVGAFVAAGTLTGMMSAPTLPPLLLCTGTMTNASAHGYGASVICSLARMAHLTG